MKRTIRKLKLMRVLLVVSFFIWIATLLIFGWLSLNILANAIEYDAIQNLGEMAQYGATKQMQLDMATLNVEMEGLFWNLLKVSPLALISIAIYCFWESNLPRQIFYSNKIQINN